MKTKKLEVKISNERLITPSGLSIVGAMLGKSDFVANCNSQTTGKRSEPYIKNGDVLLTYIGLLCQGKTRFEAVNEMIDGDSDFFKMALGINKNIPSTETLRQRMDSIGSSLRSEILNANISLLKNCSIEPTALPNGYVPVDIDVTPLDNSKTKKEGVSRTYKGFDGYAPIMAYIGIEGYLINSELRDGKQHCQKNTPDFLRETLKLCRQITDKPLLVRLDSGNDAAENLGVLIENGAYFIVKRNPRNESKEDWLDNVKEWCLPENIHSPRDGKTVYIGSTWKDVNYTDSDKNKQTICMRMGYEVIERNTDKHRQILLFPDIELNTFWTNTGLSDDEIIELYHKHGESEQFHSEIKSDMDIERLPSGKFDTNELVLELTILAYNILRIMGQVSLNSGTSPKTKRSVKRRRIRTVINNLILIAGRVTTHCRKVVLALGRSNVWRYAFMNLFRRFAPNG